VRNLSETFRGSLPQNSRKKENNHPDFTAKLTIWGTAYSVAAWLNHTKKADPYIALRLTSEGTSQSEKIKLVIWNNHDRSSVSKPRFASTQEIFGHDFALRAWIMPAGDNYRLEIVIEPLSAVAQEVSDALLGAKERIANFLAETGVASLPPMQFAPAKLPIGADRGLDGPDDIPF
jgi:hypothetical protein